MTKKFTESEAMEIARQGREEDGDPFPTVPAHLMRVLNPSNICVHLIDSGSIVHAELCAPLSPRSHLNGQSVNAFSPAPARIHLGPYDTSQHKFTGCVLEAQIPDTRYTRVKYGKKG